jgi:ABC-type sugar transport system ATPase subunit
MSGRKEQSTDGLKAGRHGKETVLTVENITTGDLPHPISFACHSGEIIGIAGLAGSGRSELLAALFGVARLTGGCVRRCTPGGKTPIRSAGHAVKTGMGFLGEDRQSMGLFVGQSILANITLPGISRVASTLGLIDGAREAATGAELVERLAIKCDSVHQDIGQLSGGNQQKVLIARWIYADSDIFLLDEPTRGVDVGTKNAIYELMFELQGMGKTILVASSELDELLRLSGRIFVLSNRRLVKEFARDECSEETILAAAFQEFVPNLLSANESANRRQA